MNLPATRRSAARTRRSSPAMRPIISSVATIALVAGLTAMGGAASAASPEDETTAAASSAAPATTAGPESSAKTGWFPRNGDACGQGDHDAVCWYVPENYPGTLGVSLRAGGDGARFHVRSVDGAKGEFYMKANSDVSRSVRSRMLSSVWSTRRPARKSCATTFPKTPRSKLR